MNNWNRMMVRILQESNYKKINDYYNFEDDSHGRISEIMESWNGEEFYDGNQWWLMKSHYNIQEAARVWCDQFQNVQYSSIFAVFGLGDPEYLLQLHNRYPENLIIFYVPGWSDLKLMLDVPEVDQYLVENVIILVGDDKGKRFRALLEVAVRYNNMQFVQRVIIPNHTKIWEEEYEEFCKIIRSHMENIVVDRNTNILFEERKGRNYLRNINRAVKESEVGALKNVLPRGMEKDYPAVIVAAGPSLDKNIDQLKLFNGRVFVVCLDASLNTVEKHGIVPDVVVSVDPNIKNPDALENEEYKKIPLVAELTTSYDVVNSHSGRVFFACRQDLFTEKLLLKHQEETFAYLDSGGSVANTAFSLLQMMGFSRIILIGQDLGYPNNQFHAKDAFENEGELDKNNKKYFYIEDIYGGKILTEYNMKMYRDWFENVILNSPELDVIDATEGGALIKGTRIMSLKEALGLYCPQEKVSFRHALEDAPYLFDHDGQVEAFRELQQAYCSIDEKIAWLEDNKKNYEMLRTLNEGTKYKTKLFKQCVQKIKNFTKTFEEDTIMPLLDMYTNKISYDVMENIDQDEETVYADINKVVDSGIRLIDAYILGGKKLKAEWEECSKKMNLSLS